MNNAYSIEIVCSTDDNYIMPTGVMLTSLFENNKGINFNIHLLHGGITDNHKEQITNQVSKYGQNISFYRMDDHMFKDFPIGKSYQTDHVGSSLATYYRLFLARILSENIEKVIYLDGDILVMDNMQELWNIDISDKAIAAVPDSYNNDITHYNRLRYPQNQGYFNAGVLIINLKYWREHNVESTFLEYVAHNPERLVCHDQDVLNIIFKDVKLVLPLKYNMLNEYWFDVRYSLISWEYEQQMLEGQKNPVIVHFTCIPKPWYKNCKHPYKKTFEKYKSISLWSNTKQKHWLRIKYFIEQFCIKFVVFIGLRKNDYIIENRYIKTIVYENITSW